MPDRQTRKGDLVCIPPASNFELRPPRFTDLSKFTQSVQKSSVYVCMYSTRTYEYDSS